MSEEAFEEAPGPGDPLDEAAARLLRSAWKSSPGVVLSLAFHGVVLAILPVIVFQEKIRELAGIPVTIGMDAKRIDPERPYKPIAGGPPSANGEGLDEPPVFFPEALEAERNESKARGSEEDRSTISGDSRAILTHFAGDAESGGFSGRFAKGPPGTNFVMGVGGGSGTGGARFGTGRLAAAGRQDLVARGGGSKYTEAAVELGLSWLARHQLADGSWSTKKVPCNYCKPLEDLGSSEVGATALAVLAFITAGYGPDSTVAVTDRTTCRQLRFGESVRAGLRYLRTRQPASGGWIQSANMSYYYCVYEHAFATMTLCEASRVTKDPEIRKAAERGLKQIYDTQDGNGAWCDTSVTGACVQALRSARNAGIELPPRCEKGVRNWFVAKGDPKTGTTGYSGRNDPDAAMNAIGLYARRFIEPGKTVSDPFLSLAAKQVADGVGDGQFKVDTYLYYYSMLGLFDYEGPAGRNFALVNKGVTTALVKTQVRNSGCADGAWDGAGMVAAYGRPISTAMSVLTLETYYRYAEIAPGAPPNANPR